MAEVGHAPEDDQDRTLFSLAHRAWRAALVFGEPSIQPEAVEETLKRVGTGQTTYDDELTLRERIRVGDAAVHNLEGWLSQYQDAERQAMVDASAPEGPIPKGAQPLGGNRWRCPRCRFIGGLRKIEKACRACSWPGKDTRDWTTDDGEESAET
jgi:hypothetical protein